MNIEAFRKYCLSKKGAKETFPFGEDTLVFKVKEKMFALTGIEDFESVNLKCDPEKAADLRERYDAIQPGYHMNKRHWNTVVMDGSIGEKLLKELIDDSYNLVVNGLSKRDRLLLSR